MRIGVDEKPPVARAALRFAARQRHVHRDVPELQHAEGESAGVEREPLPDDLLHARRFESEHLQVDVLHLPRAAQQVAH